MKKENRSSDESKIAEGINTEDELKRDATKEELDKGDYTEVTTLSLDENDPTPFPAVFLFWIRKVFKMKFADHYLSKSDIQKLT